MLGKVMPGHLWYLRLVERNKASTVSEQDFRHESLKLISPSRQDGADLKMKKQPSPDVTVFLIVFLLLNR